MTTHRHEKDSMGAIDVPADKLWGAQTQRSLEHFRISTEKMPVSLIQALALTKRAAAKVNQDLGLLTADKATAIINAADEVLAGKHPDEFPLAIWQTGSGTQSNMNMNEVLANRASELLGGVRGMERKVHPNDDVNKSQSSNDVFPTAMHVAAVIAIREQLIPQLNVLKATLNEKAQAFRDIVKIGRTHLQDATPLTLGQEISGWVAMLEHNLKHIEQPAASGGAGAGRDGGRDRVKYPSGICGARGGGAGGHHRTAVRHRAEQIRSAGDLRCAGPPTAR
jgi:fumarate hydratase class II